MEPYAGDSENSRIKSAKEVKNFQNYWSDDDDAILAAVLDNHTSNQDYTKHEESSSQSNPNYSNSAEKQKVTSTDEPLSENQLWDKEQAVTPTSDVQNVSNEKEKITPANMANETNNHNDDTGEKQTVTLSNESNLVKEEMVHVRKPLTPLRLYRPGYLWVSDLTKQHWCEQMLLYTFTVPTIPVEDPVMTAGSNLHLARELAVHDIVRVEATSREDTWAIKVLNLLSAVQGFLNGVTLAREIPIFGAPFDKDVFLVGLIDELRFDPDSYTIDLSELKTRTVRSHPKRSQQQQNRLQVMLYKKLFDDLVKGKVSKEMVSKHLKLKLDKPFGEDVKGQLDSKFVTGSNLSELLDFVFTRIQALTCVSQLTIEYVLQGTNESLGQIPVEYDDDELKATFEYYLNFWQGQREVVGVELEDAWKCQRCDFADICQWRERKAKEHSAKNTK